MFCAVFHASPESLRKRCFFSGASSGCKSERGSKGEEKTDELHCDLEWYVLFFVGVCVECVAFGGGLVFSVLSFVLRLYIFWSQCKWFKKKTM